MRGRIRTVKPEFFQNRDLCVLPFEYRLLFQGLWCYADREGRLEDDAQLLTALIFPRDPVDVELGLIALAAARLIERYEVDGRRYLLVVNFTKHQNVNHREPVSTLPAPPVSRPGTPGHAWAEQGDARASRGDESAPIAQPTETPRPGTPGHAQEPPGHAREEGKGMGTEGKGTRVTHARRPPHPARLDTEWAEPFVEAWVARFGAPPGDLAAFVTAFDPIRGRFERRDILAAWRNWLDPKLNRQRSGWLGVEHFVPVWRDFMPDGPGLETSRAAGAKPKADSPYPYLTPPPAAGDA